MGDVCWQQKKRLDDFLARLEDTQTTKERSKPPATKDEIYIKRVSLTDINSQMSYCPQSSLSLNGPCCKFVQWAAAVRWKIYEGNVAKSGATDGFSLCGNPHRVIQR
jgi:hypothetical protein